MKTKEEILNKYESFHWSEDGCDEQHYYRDNVLMAMEEYAQEQVKNIAYEPVLHTVFKTDTVVFFEMDEDCKFYDINGTEVTTDEIMKHPHFIQDQKGYMILNGG